MVPPMDDGLLAHLPPEEAQRIQQVGRRRTFARGDIVFHRGDPADTLHIVRKGRFGVTIVTPLGDTAMLSVLGPGRMFGEMALIGSDPRSATVTALEPAETLSIHQIDFDGLRKRHPEIGQLLVGLLADQVRRLSEQLVEALYVPADRRVLRRLSDVAELYPADGPAEVPLTQDNLAAMAGTSRATVNKVLRQEEDRGTLKLSRGRTTILDGPAIARRAGTRLAP